MENENILNQIQNYGNNVTQTNEETIEQPNTIENVQQPNELVQQPVQTEVNTTTQEVVEETEDDENDEGIGVSEVDNLSEEELKQRQENRNKLGSMSIQSQQVETPVETPVQEKTEQTGSVIFGVK